jgi:hypothetical protein
MTLRPSVLTPILTVDEGEEEEEERWDGRIEMDDWASAPAVPDRPDIPSSRQTQTPILVDADLTTTGLRFLPRIPVEQIETRERLAIS